MFQRFTDRARKVMALANQEAQRFNHEYIGTEHILLGLVKEGRGVGATVLRILNVDIEAVRLEVEKLVKGSPDVVIMGKLPHTPRAKNVIEYAIAEARTLNHRYVGTEHILLGLLRETEGLACQVLLNLGLDLTAVRDETLELLGERKWQQEPEPGFMCHSPDEGARGKTNYKDLPEWQKADALAREIYEVTGKFPKEEIGGVASRLREVALAIPPHIAEACDHRTPGEARWFLNAALGSLRELRYLLDFSKRLGHLKDQDYQILDVIAEDVSGLLRKFHGSLQ